jgi:hypothetical protein
MTDQDDNPDLTEDPRGRDVGAGYPEEQPGGANPGAERTDEAGDTDAPDTQADEDADPGQATGNPGAAGADS